MNTFMMCVSYDIGIDGFTAVPVDKRRIEEMRTNRHCERLFGFISERAWRVLAKVQGGIVQIPCMNGLCEIKHVVELANIIDLTLIGNCTASKPSFIPPSTPQPMKPAEPESTVDIDRLFKAAFPKF